MLPLEFEECSENEVRYGGKAYFTIVTDQGDTKKVETGVEFMYKEEVKGVTSGCSVIGTVTAENPKVIIKNGIVSVSALLIYKGKVITATEEEYVCDISGANVKESEIEYTCLPQKYKADFTVEDEFELPLAITDVLWHGEKVKISEVSAGIGGVNVSGEVEVSMLVKSSDGSVSMHTKCVELRFEGEASNVLPSSVAVVGAYVKGAKLSITAYEQSSKSAVSAYITLQFNGVIYEVESARLILDAYSTKKELVLDKKDYLITSIKGVKAYSTPCEIEGLCKIPENARLICPLFAKIESVEQVNYSGGVELKGVITATLLVKEESALKTVKCPVNYSAKFQGANLSLYQLSTSGFNANDLNGEITFNLTLNATFVESEPILVKGLRAVEEGEDLPVQDSAITVCVPSPGDTLWELGKSLCVSEEEITKLNDGLNFPLTGEERVVIYREINKE